MLRDLDINKVIGNLLNEKSKEATKKFIDFWTNTKFKKKYGFPPQEYCNISKKIYETGKNPHFLRLITLIGKDHWAINLIRIGISICELNDKGEKDKIDIIRDKIWKDRGLNALRILNMGSTGAIKGVINYLDNLSMKGFSKEALIEEFDRLLKEWEGITIFVQKGTDSFLVKNSIVLKILYKLNLLFVFSYGEGANKIAMESIAELNNKKQLEGYLLDNYPTYDGAGIKVYMWCFTKIQN